MCAYSPCLYSTRQYGPLWFLCMCSTDKSNVQLVRAWIRHQGIGHQQYACSSCFFAADEMKIVIARVLLEYEWKLLEGFDPKTIHHGISLLPDPFTTLLVGGGWRRLRRTIKSHNDIQACYMSGVFSCPSHLALNDRIVLSICILTNRHLLEWHWLAQLLHVSMSSESAIL